MVKEATALTFNYQYLHGHSQPPEVSLVLEDSMPSYDILGHIVYMHKLNNTDTLKNEINFIK